MENTLWDVVTSPGKTERMTLDQLDASFQAGVISEGTLVREPGTSDWRPLYEIAGLEPPNASAPSNLAPERLNDAPVAPMVSQPAVGAQVNLPPAAAQVASLKSTINGAGFVHLPSPTNGASHANTQANGLPVASAKAEAVEAAPGSPFSPSPSMTAPPSGDTPSVRVPPPSKLPQLEAQAPAERPGLPGRAPRGAPKTSKPPVAAVRRTGPPTSRTARGVPLPSIVAKDELGTATGPVKTLAGTGSSLAAATVSHEANLNPKPLTPPKTTSRRVSAPPAAMSANTGARTRRAPPSILSAAAPNTALTPPPPPPAPVVPRSAPPPPSGTSLTHGHHPNPELAPWDVGGGGSHPPMPFHGNPLVATPTPEPVVANTSAVQVLPAPVAITMPPEQPIPLAEPNSSKRLNAPPLPANAFAHLTPDAQPVAVAAPPQPAVPFEPLAGLPFAPQALPQPQAPLHAAANALPAAAPAPFSAAPFAQAPSNPASLYSALGFSNPPQESSTPFDPSALTVEPSAMRAVPLKASGVSWGEVIVLALATVVAGFVVLQRNGLTREWFGPNPHSTYARFETNLVGPPGVDTVAGVKALLKELSAGSNRPDGDSSVKTTSGTSAKNDE